MADERAEAPFPATVGDVSRLQAAAVDDSLLTTEFGTIRLCPILFCAPGRVGGAPVPRRAACRILAVKNGRRSATSSPGTWLKFLKYCHFPPSSLCFPIIPQAQTSALPSRYPLCLLSVSSRLSWCFCFFAAKVSPRPDVCFPLRDSEPGIAVFPPPCPRRPPAPRESNKDDKPFAWVVRGITVPRPSIGAQLCCAPLSSKKRKAPLPRSRLPAPKRAPSRILCPHQNSR